MKSLLFKEAFDKASKQSGKDTKHGISSHLERIFSEELKHPVNKITFVRYYEKYIDNNLDITNNPNSDLLNKISTYLEYNNYHDFILKNSKQINALEIEEKPITKPPKVYTTQRILLICIATLLVSIIIIFVSIDKTKWMVWQEDHYVETNFDTEKYSMNQLKIYKEERILNFKKIDPDCNYSYFNKDGSVRVWYGKNENKELQFFTDIGLHPDTGKTLKPISQYMIDKYICIKNK